VRVGSGRPGAPGAARQGAGHGHHRSGRAGARPGDLRADPDRAASRRHGRAGAGGDRLAARGRAAAAHHAGAARGGAGPAAPAGVDEGSYLIMSDVYVLDAVRTPIGRYGGALAAVRPDDLAATVLSGLMARSPDLDPATIDDVLMGDANGAGEDNRNVAR